MIGALNHVGVATPSIADSIKLYRDVLGATRIGEPFDLPAQGVKVCFIDTPTAQIELIEPYDDTSPIVGFLAKNPNGKIPVLELEDGSCLWESNAILNYLAEGSEFLPTDPRLRTQVLQWQFFEQYSHEPFIAVARYIKVYLGMPEERREEYEAKQLDGYHALNVMEQQLLRTPYLVGDHYSIADVALYAYTHVAEEGGFDLGGYPAIRQWLQRVASHPRHVGMYD